MTQRPIQAPSIRRARTAFLWVGLIVPLTLLALSAAVIAAWLPQLPDPAATHWGAEGVDGFGPRWMVLLTPLIGASVVLLLAIVTLATSRGRSGPRWSQTARFLGAMNLGLGAFLSATALATTGVQRGLSDAADAGDIGPWMLAGFALLLGLGVAGWFLQPRAESPPTRAAEPAAVPLSENERAAWFGVVSIARGGQVTLGILALVLFGATAFTVARAPGAPLSWIALIASFAVLLAIGCGLAFRVRVSDAGLQVRSLLGWPNTRIALADVAKVEVVDVNPFAEFGGWGWRLGLDGRRGVVLRTGPALQVTQESGRVFVVTVDGAAEAAAVLEGLRARATSTGGHR